MQILKDLQQQVRNFFGVSSTEANAFIILLPLLIISLLLIPFYHNFFASHEKDYFIYRQQLLNLSAELEKNKRSIHEEYQVEPKLLSPVDPNIAKFDDLLLLNPDTIIAARIIKYRNSGGKFSFKEDLLKIYGFNKSRFLQIKDQINLPAKPSDAKKATEVLAAQPNSTYKTEKATPVKAPEPLLFNINQADSLTLIKIRGIGPVLSSRIIKYRNLLGGFTDTIQYKEVYGLSPEVLEQLYLSAVIDKDFKAVPLNINEADKETLARHPYISWKIAGAIVAFRKQHGKFGTLDELLEIKLLDHKTFKRIVPYLSLQ
ncbi:MAG: ComEA family DNA-binding protein [Candidatus Cyclobacteriaceae bacterium M2_1C_046]